MKKRIAVIVMAALLSVCIFGCGKKEESSENGNYNLTVSTEAHTVSASTKALGVTAFEMVEEKAGAEAGFYGTATTESATIRITGQVYLGELASMFDSDPDIVADEGDTTPTDVKGLVSSYMDVFGNSDGQTTAEISGVSFVYDTGAFTTDDSAVKGALVLYGAGQIDNEVCFVSITVEVMEADDVAGCIGAEKESIISWLNSIEIK